VFALVLKGQIEELRVRLSEDIEKQMENITCTQDIRDRPHVIGAILGIKQALEPFTYTSRPYQPPALPDLETMESIANKDDLRKLFEFFRGIHFTLFEIRMKLCAIYEQLSVKAMAIEYLTAYALCLKQIKEYAKSLETP